MQMNENEKKIFKQCLFFFEGGGGVGSQNEFEVSIKP